MFGLNKYDLLDAEMYINCRLKYVKGIKKLLLKIKLAIVQTLLIRKSK